MGSIVDENGREVGTAVLDVVDQAFERIAAIPSVSWKRPQRLTDGGLAELTQEFGCP
jgi:hypothetical protein